MGNALRVLIPTAKYPGYSLEDIHDDLINSRLFNDLGENNVDYFSFWDEAVAKESYFGKDYPEKIKKEAKEWNKGIEQEMRKTAVNIAQMNADEIVEYLRKDLNAFHFYEAISAFDNHFHYGESRLVYSKAGDFYIYIPFYLMKDIQSHPENWAMISVIYH